MIQISFLAGELLLAAVYVLLRLFVWRKNRRIDWKREALLLLMYVNLAVVLRFTFYPMSRVSGHVQPLVFQRDAVWPFRVNLIPLVHLLRFDSRRDLLLNVIGNCAMFIPTGIILPILYPRLNRGWKVIAAGAGISLCIELLQLPFAVRASDVDDLILNTLGVVLGYGIFRLCRRKPQK